MVLGRVVQDLSSLIHCFLYIISKLEWMLKNYSKFSHRHSYQQNCHLYHVIDFLFHLHNGHNQTRSDLHKKNGAKKNIPLSTGKKYFETIPFSKIGFMQWCQKEYIKNIKNICTSWAVNFFFFDHCSVVSVAS